MRLRCKLFKKRSHITSCELESEEFVKNQNCYINYRKNDSENRYAEVGANLGLHYQSAYDKMQYEAQ